MLKSGLIVISLFTFCALFAQEKKIGTVYFDFDKYNIDATQAQLVTDFVREIDTTKTRIHSNLWLLR